MSDTIPPKATIRPQVLSTTALDGAPVVLVDDTNYLVDDTRAFVGSQTTAIEDLKVNTNSNAPKLTVRPRR